jgi:5-formyltetrahydrofolate cyclo-ligase
MKKKELREKYKKLRSQLSNREQHQISKLIVEKLVTEFDLVGKKISCFVPIIRFQEVNTWLILDEVKADFYLPVIDANDQLKHIRYEGKDKLKESSWGILEPQSGEETTSDTLDIVLVPMLAINDAGYRVGYGKGYYDKFLATCKPDCIFIGLYQFETFEVIDDVHAADIPLHYCITPQGVHAFKRR